MKTKSSSDYYDYLIKPIRKRGRLSQLGKKNRMFRNRLIRLGIIRNPEPDNGVYLDTGL